MKFGEDGGHLVNTWGAHSSCHYVLIGVQLDDTRGAYSSCACLFWVGDWAWLGCVNLGMYSMRPDCIKREIYVVQARNGLRSLGCHLGVHKTWCGFTKKPMMSRLSQNAPYHLGDVAFGW